MYFFQKMFHACLHSTYIIFHPAIKDVNKYHQSFLWKGEQWDDTFDSNSNSMQNNLETIYYQTAC